MPEKLNSKQCPLAWNLPDTPPVFSGCLEVLFVVIVVGVVLIKVGVLND